MFTFHKNKNTVGVGVVDNKHLDEKSWKDRQAYYDDTLMPGS